MRSCTIHEVAIPRLRVVSYRGEARVEPAAFAVQTRWNDYKEEQLELCNDGDVEVSIGSIKTDDPLSEHVVSWVPAGQLVRRRG
eukprot:SAG25_NODE_12003_length_290_cov_0.518325_1_plen_83_part_01